MFLRNILAYCAFRGPDNEQDVYIAYHDYEIAPGDHNANHNVQLRMIPANGGEPEVLVELFGVQGNN